MRKKKTFMGMAIVIAILILGVGYAAIEGVDLFVNGTANVSANADFSVEFDTSHTVVLSTTDQIKWIVEENPTDVNVVTGAYSDATNATMTVYLDSAHRSANAIYKIQNKSQELKSTVKSTVSGLTPENEAFINVVTTLYSDDACTQVLPENYEIAPGDAVYLKVEASLKKLPADDISGATFKVTIEAEPAASNDLN